VNDEAPPNTALRGTDAGPGGSRTRVRHAYCVTVNDRCRPGAEPRARRERSMGIRIVGRKREKCLGQNRGFPRVRQERHVAPLDERRVVSSKPVDHRRGEEGVMVVRVGGEHRPGQGLGVGKRSLETSAQMGVRGEGASRGERGVVHEELGLQNAHAVEFLEQQVRGR